MNFKSHFRRRVVSPTKSVDVWSIVSVALASWLLVCSGTTVAVEPTIRNVDVRGLQIGEATRVIVDGTDLSPEPQLLLPWPQAQAQLQPGATATRATFEVRVPDDAVAGLEQLRLATTSGVTAPVVIGVDRLPQLPFAPQIAALPVALHGSLTGSTVLETQFTLTSATDLTVEVEAQRLAGKLRPVLHLFDEQRRQVAWSWPQRALTGDTRLTLQLAAGVYRVQLHDVEYAGPAPGHFRLKIGTWHHADAVFPAAVTRGSAVALQLVGRLPADRVELPTSDLSEPRAAPWPAGVNASGPRPVVVVSDQTEIVEPAATGAPHELNALPVAVNGRLAVPGEEDRYRVPVTAGTKLKFEVFGERLGSNLDLVLAVQDEKGSVLARADDAPNTSDPSLEFTVPANLTHLTLVVSESLGRGGDAAIYRCTVQPVSDSARPRDFQLATPIDRLHVPFAGRTVLPVIVDRQGYEGPIRLAVDGLPAGMNVDNGEIPTGMDGCLVTLQGGLPGQLSRLSVVGASEEPATRRSLLLEQHPLGNLQPWLRRELAVMATTFSPFSIQWSDLPPDASWPLGGKRPLTVAITRPEGDATPVRFTMVVGQNVPRVNNNPDLNRAIRLEKPVELPADQAVAELVALVPPELSSTHYDVAVTAEMLSADKSRVLAVTTTAVKRLPVLNPVGFALAQATIDSPLDPKTGAMVKLAGRVERRGGFAGEITITASGAPGGVRADKVTVAANTDTFEFPITFPASFKPGEVSSLRLVASGIPDATKPNQIVRTKEVAVTIKLAAPPATP